MLISGWIHWRPLFQLCGHWWMCHFWSQHLWWRHQSKWRWCRHGSGQVIKISNVYWRTSWTVSGLCMMRLNWLFLTINLIIRQFNLKSKQALTWGLYLVLGTVLLVIVVLITTIFGLVAVTNGSFFMTGPWEWILVQLLKTLYLGQNLNLMYSGKTF